MSDRFAIDLIYADGRTETRVCDAREITIGRATDATVQVTDVPELAPLQLLCVARSGGVWVSDARDASVEALSGGKPVGNSMIPWGSEVDVGSLTLRLRRLRTQAARRGPQPIFLILAGGALVAGALVLLSRDRGLSLPSTTAEPPALFDDEPATCTSERPLRAASSLLREAAAREDRRPFDAQDGIRAVAVYRDAVACLERVRPDHARAVDGRRKTLAETIDGEYRALVLAQRRALRDGDLMQIERTTRALAALVDHRSGAYRTWLRTLHRHVSVRLANAKKKKKKTPL